MKIIGNLKFLGALIMLTGLFSIFYQIVISPIFIVMGITLIITDVFRNNNYNKAVYNIIIVILLVLMVIGEHFIMLMANIWFYICILMVSIGIFSMGYFSLTIQERSTKREKTLSWIGTILFSIGFFGLFSFIYTDFRIAIITAIIVTITVIISLLIRKKKFGKVF